MCMSVCESGCVKVVVNIGVSMEAGVNVIV